MAARTAQRTIDTNAIPLRLIKQSARVSRTIKQPVRSSRPVKQSTRSTSHTSKAKRNNKHRFLALVTWLLVAVSLLAVVARALPADVQALPYVPTVVSITPWFIIVSVLALVFAALSRRLLAALLAMACLVVNIWWQYPFFSSNSALPSEATSAVAQTRVNTDDAYARVMTCNVYEGQANAQTIVDMVRDERVEVLALQETTDDFVDALKKAGIEAYLPYAQISSADGVFGNGLWSASPLGAPVDDDVNSSASFMPGGTVEFAQGKQSVRFVSVHTTAPVAGYWRQWKRSLDELGLKRDDSATRYVFMGDFNATMDHTPMRDFLGSRFQDAAYSSGHGFAFTWPTNRITIPIFAGIDHVIVDRDIAVGQVQVRQVSGSDHAALLATIAVLN